MATLATNQITPAGIVDMAAVMVTAAGGGDKVRPGPGVFVEVNNGGGAGITVTVDDPLSKSPVGAVQFNPDLSVAVGAGKRAAIGPLPAERFAGTADGLVAITYSAVTSVTVGAFST